MRIENQVATRHSAENFPAHGSSPGGAGNFTRIVTTSWDEGSQFDHQVAGLLTARNLAGTFYLPVKGRHKSSRMDLADFSMLDRQNFEIGAYGVAHPNLCACDPKQRAMEIETCKARLEEDLGREVFMFAYPQGRYNRQVIDSLKRAGYIGARTTAMLGRNLRFNPFLMPTSLRVYPFSRNDYLRSLAGTMNVSRLWRFAVPLRRARNWRELAKILFDTVLRDGGVWHLYGQSWEINQLRLWDGLREVLDYVSNRPGVLYLSNGRLVELCAARFLPQSVPLRPLESEKGLHA